MLKVMVQKLFAGTVPPVRLIPVVPAFAVNVPPQPLTTPGVDETTRPVGNVSLNATPVSERPLVLVILNDKVVLPPSGIEGERNVFRMLGGETTVKLALDELPVPPSVDVTGPAVFK